MRSGMITPSTVYSLISRIRSHRYVMIEGFECVGKTTLIKRIDNEVDDIRVWRPEYHLHSSLFKDVDYKSRYLLGVTLTQLLLDELITIKDTLVVDRGLISGFVYDELYNEISLEGNLNYLRSRYIDVFKRLGVLVVYINHNSLDLAHEMFNNRQVLETYDEFTDFDHYWDTYQKADELYRAYLTSVEHVIINPNQF